MNEPFEEPPVVYTSEVYAAEREFAESERTLLEAVEEYTNNPYRRRNAETLQGETKRNGQAFNNFILAIAEDEELDVSEKANSISTAYCSAQNKRLEHFRNLAPDADYEEGDTTADEVSENIGDLFSNGLQPNDIAIAVTNNYLLSFAVDFDSLLDTVRAGKLARSITFARDASGHALEIGKNSAALAIGAVVAHQIIKKLNK